MINFTTTPYYDLEQMYLWNTIYPPATKLEKAATNMTKSEKAIFRVKVNIKVTRPLILVSFERALLMEYACQIWSLYLFLFKSYSWQQINVQTRQKWYAPDLLMSGHNENSASTYPHRQGSVSTSDSTACVLLGLQSYNQTVNQRDAPNLPPQKCFQKKHLLQKGGGCAQ